MKPVHLAFLITCALPIQTSWSAERSITWTDEVCTNTIRFDPKKYDEARLRNTIDLVIRNSGTSLFTPDPAFTPKQVQALSLERFQAQCDDAIRNATELTFIDLPGIEAYRQAGLEQVRDGCAYGVAKIRGAKESPSFLRDYAPAAEPCSRFVDALEGKSELVVLWRDMVLELCQRNGDPSGCRRRHFGYDAKPDGMEWVKLDVWGYG